MFNKAARLLPLVGQTATRQSKSLLRPAARDLPVAGPSRIPCRSLATPSSTIGHAPHPVDAGAPGVNDGVVGSDTFVDAESQAALEKEADAIVDMPPNLRFVDLSGYKEKVKRGKVLHRSSDPLNPILLPLSHLGSANPTGPSPENLSVSLDPTVFSQATRRDILHRNVVWYLSTLRQGNQQTKTRSTVNYSGRKLRRQKGTGKARVGDASSNIRRGGAPAFPLHNRDHAQKINRKVRVLGLRIALSTKLRTGLLRVVQDLDEANWQGTGEAQRALCDSRAVFAPTSVEAAEPVVAEETEAAAAVVEEAPAAEVETAEGSKAAVEEVVRRFGTAKDVSILFVHAPIFTPEQEERIAHFERVTRNIPGIELMSTDDLTVWHILKYEWLVMDTAAVDAVSSPEWLEAEEDEWMGDLAAEVVGADAAQAQQVQA